MADNLPPPTINADSAQYWEAARREKLVIRKCRACDALHFMPRAVCPSCWSHDLEWVEATGRGKIHSFTIIRRAPLPAFVDRVPYAVALIDLSEGPRMMANIVGENALNIRIGDEVEVTFERRGEGAVPQFKLLSA
ncbi:Zn-ribbon domain-containing OB-fold protein [Hyphomicrobium sp. CS1BSMeth3]|uniref:Zn-ribbon domain-containing OB-fold protein n=1 Tax=Hyphomicrobium sp. CS1BSMeth3 TaxID=1892844 RepID=UPI000931D11D|nr:Zn-ribbon domain-containing OB-fold protein [Hyphomicrobium sp. CS1BSMeth3]